MKHSLLRWGAACLAVLAIAGCGGGGSGGETPAPGTAVSVKDAIAAASTVAANDTATSTSASFTVLQNAGLPAVTVNSPPVVNFAVFSDGAIKTGLVFTDARFAIAKLVPGTDGNPDQWMNYISTTATAVPTVGPGGAAVLASALQATTDTAAADRFSYNADGYYTYTFKTDIKDITKTNGVTFEPNRTHRVAIQLSYKNAAGEDVKVNPYFDFTIGADGKSVAVSDSAKTRKMTDVGSCNGCHEKLALHGGGRVDTQFCVMCHNPGTTDPNSGNVLNLATMVHKIHSGKLLNEELTDGKGGEDYTIWGYKDSKHDYAEVGFPQDLRNCAKCHSGANPKTPQGDNWKIKPSKEACLTCHANQAGSDWDASHKIFATSTTTSFFLSATAAAKDLPNSACANCHKAGSNLSPERVHFNQVETNAANFKMNIEGATYDAGTRKVTVKYFLSNPNDGNTAYDLTSGCTGTPSVCSSSTKFGNLRFILAYQSLVGQSTASTEFSSYNNGGNGVSAFAYTGTNDGSNHYTVTLPAIPADTATHVASGTARVVSYGQIKEAKLEAKAATDPRPEVMPQELVNTGALHSFKDVVLSGTLQPRRTVVDSQKCNACHSLLGTGSGSNTVDNAFHGGARNTVEACVVCHDPNRVSSTVMTNGLAYNESYQFKRMIHGIHGGSRRTTPFTHGNKVVGAFNKDGSSVTGGAPLAANVDNFAAEVAWPGVGINCNVCHADNSYKNDRGTLGATILKGPATLVGTGLSVTADADPKNWLVISPKAASCTACHDSSKAIAHVTSFPGEPGNASFGNLTQGVVMARKESCDDCHSSGGFKGVDIVHGQK